MRHLVGTGGASMNVVPKPLRELTSNTIPVLSHRLAMRLASQSQDHLKNRSESLDLSIMMANYSP